ncbi:hypothetical protein [Desulfolithobacter dissulfuricans]|nr:hypothetical protein [Desulfolithobacter dissulfuricans]
MVPMRAIPFRVLCLLGMNDGDFPRVQRPLSFDLMAREPRIGDRNRRDDDRYLFLEALLSAREHLHISWIGRDQRDMSLLPPSVVVSELRDYIDRSSVAAGAGNSSVSDTPSVSDTLPVSALLTVEYPLQPFSASCFTGTVYRSHAAHWLPPRDPRVDSPAFVRQALSDPGDDSGPGGAWESVDINLLARFWSHPVRFFLQERLGLRLWVGEEALAENEPFAPDALERYQLARQSVDCLLSGREPGECSRRLRARGLLPHGGFGESLMAELYDRTSFLVRNLSMLGQERREPVSVDLDVAGIRLVGTLDGLHAKGLVTWRPTRWKGGDLIRLWVLHLVLNLAAPEGTGHRSFHLATDSVLSLQPVETAREQLAELLHWYQCGLREPLHFFPGTSLAWARARRTGRGAEQREAEKVWYDSFKTPGEQQDLAYRIALRGRDPLDQGFRELTRIWDPVLDVLEEDDAAA